MQNDIGHQLSSSKTSWRVNIQDVTMKRDGFLTLESILILWIHLSRHRRQRALCQLCRGTCQGELVV